MKSSSENRIEAENVLLDPYESLISPQECFEKDVTIDESLENMIKQPGCSKSDVIEAEINGNLDNLMEESGSLELNVKNAEIIENLDNESSSTDYE